jgi:photosystem II stability/assembly factor-like uncharacterized protein
MAFEGVNGVVAASIEAINGVAKGDIEGINGSAPPAGASHTDLWVLVGKSGKVGTSADGSSWTVYDMGGTDNWAIVYNKDSSGNDMWGMTQASNTAEFLTSSTPDDSGTWGTTNLDGSFAARGLAIDKESGKWYFATKSTSGNKLMYTGSRDADSFGTFDYSSVSSNYGFNYGVASNGSGSIMIGVRDDLIATSSAGLVGTANFLGAGKTINKGVAQGGGKWFVAAGGGKAAMSADGGQNWTDISTNISGANTTALNAIAYDGGANGTGTWVIVGNSAYMARSTDNGVSWTEIDHSATHTDKLQHIATNGSGTWVAVGDDGRIGTSTDHGAAWSWSDESIAQDLKHVAINWQLPLVGG